MHIRPALLLPAILPLLAACSMEFPEDYGLEAQQGAQEEGVDTQTTAAITDADIAGKDEGLAALRGRWSVDPAWCEDPGLGQVIAIAENEADEEAGRGCQIINLVDDGAGHYTGPLACTVDGVLSTKLVRLTPSKGSISLSYLGGGEPETTLRRC